MIHGYKRQKRVKSQQEVREQEEMSNKINQKLGEFFAIPRENVNPQQIPKYLQFIALLMQIVSDIPTVFNFRRQLIQKAIKEASVQEVAKMLGGEVKLTTKLIQSDPKSYTIWSYRQWLVKSLFKINPEIIKKEKELIQMLLMKDEKNFHVWNYRNWLNSIQSFIDEQINFTTQKIKSNPFNFSPYHFRTKFIHQKYSQLVDQNQIDENQRKEIITFGMSKQQFKAEIETVTTAIFLNPHEEAPWSYYNWILGQLVPSFIVHQQKNENQVELLTNIKVSSFQQLIQAQNLTLKGKSGKLQSDKWTLNHSGDTYKIVSNLTKKVSMKLESTGRLFLGEQYDSKWINQNIKQIFNDALKFIDQVIESQEDTKCRFAILQKTSIYKYILQSGTNQVQFQQIVEKGFELIKSIENQSKAHKYVIKQIQYWERLRSNSLSVVEKALRNKYS